MLSVKNNRKPYLDRGSNLKNIMRLFKKNGKKNLIFFFFQLATIIIGEVVNVLRGGDKAVEHSSVGSEHASVGLLYNLIDKREDMPRLISSIDDLKG